MQLDSIAVTNIFDVTTVFLPKDAAMDIVNRKTYGLTLCKQGRIRYESTKKNCISEPHTAIFLPQGESYRLLCTKAGHFPVINFTSARFITNELTAIPLRDNAGCFDLFDRLRRLHGFPCKKMEEMAALYLLLSKLEKEQTSQTEHIPAAIDYINENFSDPELTNKRIATACDISEVYLRKLFSAEYGSTPKQYVLQIRMLYAKQLLEERACSVTEVAVKCGYASPYHFSRSFRRINGLTPTEYRETARQKYL